MSNTKVGMIKVCQMLDDGWSITIHKSGSYFAEAKHSNEKYQSDAEAKLTQALVASDVPYETAERIGTMKTEDFTPERALTRLAYKVYGDIV